MNRLETPVEPAARAVDDWLKTLPGAVDLPFRPDPPALYGVCDLYDGLKLDQPDSYRSTWDASVYRWTRTSDLRAQRRLSMTETLAARLHDAAMDRLVADYLDPKTSAAIGFMGGHAVERTEAAYPHVARIARDLRRRGFKIVTGGGPGLMEAANFGAFMAPYGEDDFAGALATLREAPNYGGAPGPTLSLEQKEAWVNTAARVRQTLLGQWNARELPASSNLGIPTWYYGSEPPNLFATVSGKYFLNSLREDGLVSLANGGLVFGKGDAGTVQEIFQNANYNYYRDSAIEATPMVFLDSGYWDPDAKAGAAADDHAKPAFPLVHKLAVEARYPFDELLLLSDDAEKIIDFLSAKNPCKTQRTADIRLLAGSR
jgi:predicted Rossmann-fold nucleotide-binding protein